MTDLAADFWAGWVAVITIVSLAGLAWLVYGAYFSPRTAGEPDEESSSPVWDEDLREGRRPPPLWWFYLIFALLVISVLYLMLYPGLGSYAGALKWSQGHHLDRSTAAFEAEFGGARRLIAEAKLDTLQANADLMASAQRIFARHCAACHGDEAKGLPGYFPDLTDDDWQWGGSAEAIELTIRNGRIAAMVPWRAALGEEGVKQVAAYTLSLSANAQPEAEDAAEHPGRTAYTTYCVVCHGAEGGGNPLFGAPDLSDDISLYGAGLDAIERSIADGRNGQMPAFGERLDDTQIRLLVALLTRGTGM